MFLASFASPMFRKKMKAGESVGAISGDGDSRSVADPSEEAQHRLTLEGKIRKLKVSYKNLSSKSEAEVSTLLARNILYGSNWKKCLMCPYEQTPTSCHLVSSSELISTRDRCFFCAHVTICGPMCSVNYRERYMYPSQA